MMNKPQQGFTLVETLVAITVIALAIMGPFQIVQKALSASYIARDQLVASALAEEGVEYVRSIRDRNYLYNAANPGSPRSWLYTMDGNGGPNCSGTTKCALDPTQNTIAACGTSCSPLRLASTNVYTQASPSGSTVTRFTRYLQISSVSVNEVQVSVTVTWETQHTQYTVTVMDNLQNWL